MTFTGVLLAVAFYSSHRLAPLLSGRGLFPPPLPGRPLLGDPTLHLLKQAGLEHLLLERFERGLDLVVEDGAISATSEGGGRPKPDGRRAIDHVHLDEAPRARGQGRGDGRTPFVRLRDRLARIVHDPPAPGGNRRGAEHCHWHGGRAAYQ